VLHHGLFAAVWIFTQIMIQHGRFIDLFTAQFNENVLPIFRYLV